LPQSKFPDRSLYCTVNSAFLVVVGLIAAAIAVLVVVADLYVQDNHAVR
jgi:hypothetical protein